MPSRKVVYRIPAGTYVRYLYSRDHPTAQAAARAGAGMVYTWQNTTRSAAFLEPDIMASAVGPDGSITTPASKARKDHTTDIPWSTGNIEKCFTFWLPTNAKHIIRMTALHRDVQVVHVTEKYYQKLRADGRARYG